jgi:hypothetical protein
MFARGFVGWGKPRATEYGVPPLTPCVVSARGRTAPSNLPDFAAVHFVRLWHKADIWPTGKGIALASQTV